MKNPVFSNIVIVLLLAVSIGHGADRRAAAKAAVVRRVREARDLILPNRSEQSYRKIDWRTSVLRGIVDAQKNDKPVMIVLMNGHPLGCT